VFRTVLGVIWVAVAAVTLSSGWDYYHLPMDERLYDDTHALFAPTGLIGQGYGVIGTAMILIGVVLYSARKRIGWLANVGKLRGWLQFHIFLCTLGPYLVLLHTTFKFGGLVSIAFWSMTAVVVSGVFGRYVYVWIPKTVNGRFLTAQALAQEQETALEAVRATQVDSAILEQVEATLQTQPPRRLAVALGRALSFPVRQRRWRREVERLLATGGLIGAGAERVIALLARRRRLAEQGALLQPFQRMFRYWHAFHLPLAAVMMLILVVHVGVTVWLGYTWIF